jgi:hypothetical protein
MELTITYSPSGKTKYFNVLLDSGELFAARTKKAALYIIETIHNKIKDDKSNPTTGDRSQQVQCSVSSVNSEANNRHDSSNGTTRGGDLTSSNVDAQSGGSSLGDGGDETQRSIDTLIASRKTDKKSGLPFPRQFQNLAQAAKDGSEQLVRESSNIRRESSNIRRESSNIRRESSNILAAYDCLEQIAICAISVAECSSGINVGTIDARDSSSVHRPAGIEPETVTVESVAI